VASSIMRSEASSACKKSHLKHAQALQADLGSPVHPCLSPLPACVRAQRAARKASQTPSAQAFPIVRTRFLMVRTWVASLHISGINAPVGRFGKSLGSVPPGPSEIAVVRRNAGRNLVPLNRPERSFQVLHLEPAAG